MMKNRILGNYIESIYSESLHEKGSPVLVSPHFLRKYNCGQIDISILSNKGVLYLFEVKKGESISKGQSRRLVRSSMLLGELLSRDVRCYVCFFRSGEIFPIY